MFATSGSDSLQMCGGRCRQAIPRPGMKGHMHGGRDYLKGYPGDSSTVYSLMRRVQEVVCSSYKCIIRLV
jgi:hypothetical protein